MPKVNVYLPDDLAEKVRAAGLPVSRICQQALASVLDRAQPPAAEPPLPEDPGLVPNHHVGAILREAFRQAGARDGVVGTGDLLRGFLDEGESLVLRTLELLGFPASAVRATLPADPPGAGGEPRLSAGARAALDRAAAAAAEQGAGVVTGSHLLLGLLADDGAAGDALRASGVTAVVTPAVLAAFYYGVSFGQYQLDAPAPQAAILDRLDTIETLVRGLGAR